MAKVIDFYFEFSSPYGYIAAEIIEEVAARHHCSVNWKPFLLGPVFKAEGTQSLVSYPMKGLYSRHDIARSARYYDIPFRWPEKFPIFSVNAARAVYWAKKALPGKDKELSQAIYRKAFGEGADISDKAILAEAAVNTEIDPDALLQGITSPDVKEQLRQEVDAAMERKVFGSPFFYVRDEAFWGVDRLPQLEKWLETGGW